MTYIVQIHRIGTLPEHVELRVATVVGVLVVVLIKIKVSVEILRILFRLQRILRSSLISGKHVIGRHNWKRRNLFY